MERNNKIKKLYQQGLSYGSIGKLVGLSRARIHQIISGYNPCKNYYERELKKFILKRDKYTCQWNEKCKNKNVLLKDDDDDYCYSNLVIHHIDFNNKNNNPENLITLCKYCHLYFHSFNHINNKIAKKIEKKNPQGIISVDKKDYMKKYHQKNKKRKNEYNKKWRKKYKIKYGKGYYLINKEKNERKKSRRTI